jgi:RNA polymerase primary sigma factor
MSVADLQELDEIKGLLARRRRLGVLTFVEVAAAVSELTVDEAELEELHGLLEQAGIEVVEDPAARSHRRSTSRSRIRACDTRRRARWI